MKKQWKSILNFLFFSVCFFLILSSCKQPNKQSNNTNPQEDVNTEAKPKIEFDTADISCVKKGLSGVADAPISTGDAVELGTNLSFTAKVTGTTTIKSWKINDKIQENQTKKTFSYQVKKEDVKDGKIKISIEQNKGFSIIVKYDDKIIKCSKSSLLSSTPIPSESSVEIGDVITLTGTPSQNKAIESWSVNNIEKAKGDKLTYTVVASECVKEGDKLVLRFSFSERELKKLKISFDPAKVQCNEPGGLLTQGKPILNENELLEGKKIVFSAKKGKYEDVKEWLVKGVSKQTGSDTFNYTVDIKDADSDEKIVVSWTINHKVKVEFDKTRITCRTKNLLGLIENKVKSGEFHSEGQTLYLDPILKEGEKFEGWYLNGKKYTSLGGLFLDNIIYKVSSSDAIDKDGYKYIEITTKTKFEEKIQVKFDEDKLECKDGDRIIHNEESVWDRTKLIFKVKAEDKGASNWYINNVRKTIGASTKRFEYVMYADQASVQGNKKVMNITFDEISLKKITLNFASDIECKNEAEEKVTSGTSLYEGEILTFIANLAEDTSISSWQMGKKKIDKTTSEIVYTLSLSDAAEASGVYTLNVSVNTIEKIKVSFDTQTIICEVSDGGFLFPKYTTVQSGELLNVGSFLRFTLVNPEKFKDSFSKWLVNGKEKSGNKDYKKFTYTIDSNDAILSGTKKEIVVTILKKDLNGEAITIKFDPDKCSATKDGKEFLPNAEAREHEEIKFVMKGKRGKKLEKWSINNVAK